MHDGVQVGLIFGASVLLSAFVTSPPESIAKIIGVTLALFIIALFVAPVVMVFQKYRKGKVRSDRTDESDDVVNNTPTAAIVETSTIEEITDDTDNPVCDEQTNESVDHGLINGCDAAAEHGKIDAENNSLEESKTLD